MPRQSVYQVRNRHSFAGTPVALGSSSRTRGPITPGVNRDRRHPPHCSKVSPRRRDERNCAHAGVPAPRAQLRTRQGRRDMGLRSRDGMRPRFYKSFALSSNRERTRPSREGAGKTGCALHPRSRVQLMHKKVRTRAYRFSGNTPAFPAQWLYGLYVLSLVNRSFLPPSSPRGVSPPRT